MDVPLWQRVICREIIDIRKYLLISSGLLPAAVKGKLLVVTLWTSRLLWPVGGDIDMTSWLNLGRYQLRTDLVGYLGTGGRPRPKLVARQQHTSGASTSTL
jgi:hypothetical protein